MLFGNIAMIITIIQRPCFRLLQANFNHLSFFFDCFIRKSLNTRVKIRGIFGPSILTRKRFLTRVVRSNSSLLTAHGVNSRYMVGVRGPSNLCGFFFLHMCKFHSHISELSFMCGLSLGSLPPI